MFKVPAEAHKVFVAQSSQTDYMKSQEEMRKFAENANEELNGRYRVVVDKDIVTWKVYGYLLPHIDVLV